MQNKSRWYGLRPLLGREYAQARLFVFAVPIVHFLILGMSRMNEWIWNAPDADITSRLAVGGLRHDDLYRYLYNNGAQETMARMWLLLAVLVLALVQIGVERRNGSQELLFSMPYSRQRIFMSKWLLGAMLVTGSLLLNTFIDAAVMTLSPYSHYMQLKYYIVQLGYSWLVVMSGYACALFVGTITGSVASQTLLTFGIVVFPVLFFSLLEQSLTIQGIRLPDLIDFNYRDSSIGVRIQDIFNYFAYATLNYTEISSWRIAILLFLLAGGLMLAIWAYMHNRTEHNGKLMIFKRGETVLGYVFVLCASMLAGMLGKELFRLNGGERIGYDIGFILGCIVSAFIIRKLLRMRLKY